MVLHKATFYSSGWIIGGPQMAGHGWRMLMECLAAGRAISLPVARSGSCKMVSLQPGVCEIRRQFKIPIGRLVKEALARIVSCVSYGCNAHSLLE